MQGGLHSKNQRWKGQVEDCHTQQLVLYWWSCETTHTLQQWHQPHTNGTWSDIYKVDLSMVQQESSHFSTLTSSRGTHCRVTTSGLETGWLNSRRRSGNIDSRNLDAQKIRYRSTWWYERLKMSFISTMHLYYEMVWGHIKVYDTAAYYHFTTNMKETLHTLKIAKGSETMSNSKIEHFSTLS